MPVSAILLPESAAADRHTQASGLRSATSAESDTLRAFATRASVFRLGFRRPRSIPLNVGRVQVGWLAQLLLCEPEPVARRRHSLARAPYVHSLPSPQVTSLR